MTDQFEKLGAHTSRLVDDFIHLREKYELLHPMLFDQAVIDTFGSDKKAHGFETIRNTLFLSCAQDIAKLSLDTNKDGRTPSIKRVVRSLGDDRLRGQLRVHYAASFGDDAEKRKVEFDHLYHRLLASWRHLGECHPLEGFRRIRDTVTAHSEVRLERGRYGRVGISELGVGWGDMTSTIEAMQDSIALIGIIVGNPGFAWDALDEELKDAARRFWIFPEAR